MRRAAMMIAGILVVALVALAAAGCGGDDDTAGTTTQAPATATTAPSTTTATETTETETTETETTGTETTGVEGNAEAGLTVFQENGCGSCHTLAAANANGQIGPNLDTALQGKSADYIRTSIVDPNADIAPGFTAGIMPQTYGQQLSEQQINDLVALLSQQ
jgi:mono/diheme cytochrome c family protein